MDGMAAAGGVPELDFDPFSRAFLEDPFPDHARLRDAGPVAWLKRYGVFAVGRHTEVRAVLQDWETFSSAAGVGLAEAYPVRVFPDAVGMPRENRRYLLPYGNMVFNSFGPHNAFFQDAVRDAAPVLEWVQEQSRRESLSATGFGAEIHAAADAGELTVEEAPQVVRVLLTAGVDTTVSGLGAALLRLATHPGQFQALRANPHLARAAFEEAVRFETPVQTFFRTTTRPAEIGGAKLGERRKVLVFMGAANRDPRRWERPDDYDIGRLASGHVGLGVGIHACVDMLLARLEGECVLTALAQQAAALDLAGKPVRRCNNTLRGLASLPLRATPA